jgi:hypothetical protein
MVYPPARKGNAVTLPADPYLVLRYLRGNIKPLNFRAGSSTSPFAETFVPHIGYSG